MAVLKPKPSAVFTPRSAGVNEQMYVERPHLQERLQRAVNGTQHIAMFGDSGCGKTWLYQRYLKREKIPFRVVDLSIALERGLDHCFRDALTDGYGWVPTSKGKTTEGGAKAVVEAHRKVEEQYSFQDVSPFDKIITELAAGNSKPKFLVFDNLEQISSQPDLVAGISRLIIRLDNPRFALSGVRFLLVGVISDMKALIASNDRAGTVVNRLTEIPEVENLSFGESADLVKRGFKRLKMAVREETQLTQLVFHLTYGNPQQVQALCYQIACEGEKNGWRIGNEQIQKGFEFWVEESLGQHKAFVEPRLNKKETKRQRRNQVLHCIADINQPDFNAVEVDRLVRHVFRDKADAKLLGVSQILKGLCEGENPLLVYIPTTGQFRFSHPKIRLAIRALLKKSENGDVERMKNIYGLRLDID